MNKKRMHLPFFPFSVKDPEKENYTFKIILSMIFKFLPLFYQNRLSYLAIKN